MKVAIVGSREGIDTMAVLAFVEALAEKHPHATVVSGGARGVDTAAKVAAEKNGLETEVYLPDWDRYGRSAGFKRNVLIVEAADVVVAFTTGSRGTQHTIDLAVEAEKPVYVYGPSGQALAKPL